MSKLDRSIAQVRDGSSLYWGFYSPDERKGGDEPVEVRFNASPEAVESFVPPVGWTVKRVQWGDTLFLGRHQSLERDSVEEMLVEMLRLATANGFQFHSWLHGADLNA